MMSAGRPMKIWRMARFGGVDGFDIEVAVVDRHVAPAEEDLAFLLARLRDRSRSQARRGAGRPAA